MKNRAKIAAINQCKHEGSMEEKQKQATRGK